MGIVLSKWLRILICLVLASPLNAMENIPDIVYSLLISEEKNGSPCLRENRFLEQVASLINDGLNIDTKYGGLTALYFAIVNESTPLARALIRAGASTKFAYNHRSKVMTLFELARNFKVDLDNLGEITPLGPNKRRSDNVENSGSRKRMKLSVAEAEEFSWKTPGNLFEELEIALGDYVPGYSNLLSFVN